MNTPTPRSLARDRDLYWPCMALVVLAYVWLVWEGEATDRVIEAGTLDTVVVTAPLPCSDDVALQAAARRNSAITCPGGER